MDEKEGAEWPSGVAWHRKATILNDRHRYKEANKCFNKVIQLKPEFAEAWKGKGVALEELGKKTEAEEAFARAEELERQDPEYSDPE